MDMDGYHGLQRNKPNLILHFLFMCHLNLIDCHMKMSHQLNEKYQLGHEICGSKTGTVKTMKNIWSKNLETLEDDKKRVEC